MRSLLFFLLLFFATPQLRALHPHLPVWGYVFVEFEKLPSGAIVNLGIVKGIQQEIDSMALAYLDGNATFFHTFEAGYFVVPLPFLHADDEDLLAFSRERFVETIPKIRWKDLQFNTQFDYNNLEFELLAVVKQVSEDGALAIEVHNNFVAHKSNILAQYQDEAGLRFVQLAFYISELYASILRQELSKVDLYATPEDLRMLEGLQHQLSRERDALLEQMTAALQFGQNQAELAAWSELVSFK
ncbi:MAG: hypothetical protein LAT76_09535 [Schleiferiaceae bacterium]|nr:hypothetical protein [Schleiferiaceae bacterium]